MEENLLKPTLPNEGSGSIKTYNISSFYIIGFICGVIPMLILGFQNLKWLNVRKPYIFVFTIASIFVFIIKYVIYYLIASGQLAIGNAQLRMIYRAGCLLLALLLSSLMKKPYTALMLGGGKHEVIWKKAISWTVLAIIIEVSLLVALGSIANG